MVETYRDLLALVIALPNWQGMWAAGIAKEDFKVEIQPK